MHQDVIALRAFNRFHTRFVGALDASYMESGLSLVEARVLYEIVQSEGLVASDLQEALGLDAGYASRILRRFQAQGWIRRDRGADARTRPIALTDEGRAAFAALDDRTRRQIEARLAPLPASDRASLTAALGTAQAILGGDGAAPCAIRTFRTGDMGLVAARQAILYAAYGWERPMEILLGEVTTAFLRDFKPGREQCWIAERGGTMAGSVFVVDDGTGVARLRLLYVEPWARGMGVGRDLVARVIAFARAAGYSRLVLWTHSVLESARRIYAQAGLRITEVAVHHDFGRPEQGETWEMSLEA